MREEKKGFSYLRLFLVIGAVALIQVVFILVGISQNGGTTMSEVFGEGTLVHSETVYLVLLLALLLPIALIALTVILVRDKVGFNLFAKKKEKDDGIRFRALCGTDREMENRPATAYQTGVSLQWICKDFRNYAAANLQLYYDLEDIRRFVSGFAVSHLMVMQGLSGTGKTSLATAFGDYLGNRSTVISVQPMWKERADVIGYFNEFTKQFSESALLKKLYEARYNDEINVIVLDEMNIARVEYYFADFLSLMELSEDNRFLDMTSDSWPQDPKLFRDGRFLIPENVWFIGTANNDDSTFAISDKVYDRAMVMNLDRKASPFLAPRTPGIRISYSYFKGLAESAKKTVSMSGENRRKVAEIDRCLTENFHITYGNRIRKQMEEYVSVFVVSGGTEEDALDDFLMKKVFRKLEGQNPAIMAKASAVLEEKLSELYDEEQMPLCRGYLHFLRQLAS
ncbi:MAG: AAA family ATPase [Lachnospiraceae bacterium]|nr:AAA family ATPase [Lachnospiraceae bacterium]MCR5530829.1 AAA family ATPase [Lachnospiraceae bacterium]